MNEEKEFNIDAVTFFIMMEDNISYEDARKEAVDVVNVMNFMEAMGEND